MRNNKDIRETISLLKAHSIYSARVYGENGQIVVVLKIKAMNIPRHFVPHKEIHDGVRMDIDIKYVHDEPGVVELILKCETVGTANDRSRTGNAQRPAN